jgi:guanyl-specific ribonuclease Sa
MQKREILFVLLALCITACSEQKTVTVATAAPQKAAAKYPGCNVEKTAYIHFRNTTETDVLRIKISGDPCYEAILHISITTKDGKNLYQYQAPYKPHTAIHWEDLEVPKDPEALIELVLKGGVFRRGKDLPAFTSKEQFYDDYYNELTTEQRNYEKLRSTQKPLFWHPTHYESWNYVVYDKKQGRGLVFMRGGL